MGTDNSNQDEPKEAAPAPAPIPAVPPNTPMTSPPRAPPPPPYPVSYYPYPYPPPPPHHHAPPPPQSPDESKKQPPNTPPYTAASRPQAGAPDAAASPHPHPHYASPPDWRVGYSYWAPPGYYYPPPHPPVPKPVPRTENTSPTQIDLTHRDEVQHMGCTCKKTYCLKLYCQCFAAQLLCGTNCRCTDCQNLASYEKQRQAAMRTILTRNPHAFDTKFAKRNPSSASHKTGCKCRKSGCMKKYCECYAGKVKCSSACRCSGCKNRGPDASPSKPYPPPPPPPPPTEPWLAAQNLARLRSSPEKLPASDEMLLAAMAMTDMGSSKRPLEATSSTTSERQIRSTRRRLEQEA